MNQETPQSLGIEPFTGNDRILVVDDDLGVLDALTSFLSQCGFRVDTATNGQEALTKIEEADHDIILCDLQMPVMTGLDLLRSLRGREEFHSTIIMMSAFGTSDVALEAIKLGAYDYIDKPFSTDVLLLTIRKAQERERLKVENELLKSQVTKRYSFSNIVAKSDSMLEIFETIKKVADYRTTVMLLGESGTGKELIARAIHYNSSRRSKRFVAVNCGAIPENLLESELFGHRRGSFTDAVRDKKGLFEEAEGGTVLLDEIGELPVHLQVKLLRVLQENEIRPVGEERAIPINVRIVAATLRDLESDVVDGRFRDDLYYRLNVVSIRIPPLRERRDDILLLTNHFIKKHQEKLGLPVFGISKDAMAALMEHEWPGNVRELENCVERAMILTDHEMITIDSLPKAVTKGSSTPAEASPMSIESDDLSIKTHTKVVEEMLIRKALDRTKGNRTHAAKLLEISHRTLLYKLKEYNLADPGDKISEE